MVQENPFRPGVEISVPGGGFHFDHSAGLILVSGQRRAQNQKNVSGGGQSVGVVKVKKSLGFSIWSKL